jgi:hypothetical protein
MNWIRRISKTLGSGLDTGLVRFHERLNVYELFESLGPDDELLCQDTNLPGKAEFYSKIRPALERGARTRMLITDPRCESLYARAAEIRERDTFIQDVEVFIRRVSSIRCSLKHIGLKDECCQILTCNDLCCMPMYIVTHKEVPVRGYSGFFLSEPSACVAHLEWTLVKGGVLDHMHDYFQQKWDRNLRSDLLPKNPAKIK